MRLKVIKDGKEYKEIISVHFINNQVCYVGKDSKMRWDLFDEVGLLVEVGGLWITLIEKPVK